MQVAAGLSRTQYNPSSRYQSLASTTEERFEAAGTTAKDTAGEVTTAFIGDPGEFRMLSVRPRKKHLALPPGACSLYQFW